MRKSIFSTLLLLLAAGLALWPPCPAHAADDIVFVSDRTGNLDIWRMDASGGNLQQLTEAPGIDDFPVVSPAGDRVAYLSNAANPAGRLDVWTMDPDGAGKLQLTSSAVDCALPQWSPDGGRVAFLKWIHHNLTRIYIIPADGSGPEQEVNVGPCLIRNIRWSRDGSTIYYDRDDGGGWWSIRVTPLGGGGAATVAQHNRHSIHPAASPDGGLLAYNHVNWSTSEVYLKDLVSGFEQLLLDSSATEPDGWTQIAWSPDGSRVALSIYPSVQRGTQYPRVIKIVDAASGLVVGKTGKGHNSFSDDNTGINGDRFVAGDGVWSADGARLVFMSALNSDWDVLTMGPDCGDPVNLTNRPGYDGHPTWIAGGDSVLQVAMDIKPGSDINPINLGSNGVLPVAVFSSESFDATGIDPAAAFLAGAPVATKGNGTKYHCQAQDVDADGRLDCMLHFETELLDPTQFEDGCAVLTGVTYEGLAFEGRDRVTLVPRDIPPEHWAYSEITACVAAGIVRGYADGNYRPDGPVTRDQMAVYVSRALGGCAEAVPEGPAAPSFQDVPADHWAYSSIEYAVQRGIARGYPDGGYHPDFTVDRAQMAVAIIGALAAASGNGGDADSYVPPLDPTFADIPADYWCYRHVEYLAALGIVSGYPDGDYRPTGLVSRDQMAVFIARAFGLL